MSKVIIDVNASVTSRLAFEPIKEYDNKVVWLSGKKDVEKIN